MRRHLASLCLCLAAIMLLLSGCWDSKTIQDVNYVVSLGFDYKEGEYRVYAQMLDFANVAKQEGGGGTKASIWIGEGKGRSVRQAMVSLYGTAQQLVYWGHVSSFVFTESALRQGVDQIIDALIRYREMRYTQWVYGTNEPIEALFNTVPFFHLSPLSSILSEPEGNYEQRSFPEPTRLNRFIADMREPGRTVLLPSMHIDKKVWKKDGEPDPKLLMNGLFLIENGNDVTWIDSSHLLGLQWLNNRAEAIQLSLHEGKRKLAQLTMDSSRHVSKAKVQEGTIVLDLEIRASGRIAELFEEMELGTIRKLAEEKVRAEIKQTFEYARRKKVDVYRGEYILYQDHFRAWSALTRNGESRNIDVKLGEVKVNVKVTQSGMYKATTRQPQF
jgi:spore germination protein KC